MQDRMLLQGPPNNLEAEQAVLGSMMISKDAALKVMALVDAQDFYRPVHQEIFDCLKSIYGRKNPLDMISLTEELRKRDKLDDCGGVEYIIALHESVPTAANAEHYAGIVVEKSSRRKIITACIEGSGCAYDEDEPNPAEKFLQIALECSRTKTPGWVGTKKAVEDAWHMLEDLMSDKPITGQIPYGLKVLDEQVDGIGPGAELTILAGRPSSGKTSLGIEACVNCVEMGLRVGLVSLETEAKRLMKRMLLRRAHVDERKIRRKQYSLDEMEEVCSRLAQAAGEFFEFDELLLMHDKSITLSELQSRVRQLVAQYANDPRPVGMIMVDYLGLIKITGKSRLSEYELTTNVVKGLKDLTLDTGVPLVALCQLRRPEKGQETRPPTMNDLRSSGQIENDADKVILVHNPVPTGQRRPDEPRSALLRVGKYKEGAGGDVPALFMGQFFQFVGRSPEEE